MFTLRVELYLVNTQLKRQSVNVAIRLVNVTKFIVINIKKEPKMTDQIISLLDLQDMTKTPIDTMG